MSSTAGRFKVGSVPYVNALPLVKYFEHLGAESPVEVVFKVPSQLPDLLDSDDAQAILVSSYEGLRQPEISMAAGICIGSEGPVESVRLFAKCPFSEIETLALDQSSMTSNRLAQILLREHGAGPMTTTQPPDLEQMLISHDACILIGDIGMTTDHENLHVMDLGEEWTRQTGLPFVWAAWMGRGRLSPELVGQLTTALDWSGCGRGESETRATEMIVKHAAEKPGWSSEMARSYLRETMLYRAGKREMEGLRLFGQRLVDAGFSEARHLPSLVSQQASIDASAF